MCVWLQIKKPTYFTIQLIFSNIHEPCCTFWYYLWVSLYNFSKILSLFTVLSAKSFQFQQNKRIPNKPLIPTLCYSRVYGALPMELLSICKIRLQLNNIVGPLYLHEIIIVERDSKEKNIKKQKRKDHFHPYILRSI